jgi:hypothetical protein
MPEITIRDLAAETGLSYHAAAKRMKRDGLQPVRRRPGNLGDLYDAEAARGAVEVDERVRPRPVPLREQVADLEANVSMLEQMLVESRADMQNAAKTIRENGEVIVRIRADALRTDRRLDEEHAIRTRLESEKTDLLGQVDSWMERSGKNAMALDRALATNARLLFVAATLVVVLPTLCWLLWGRA